MCDARESIIIINGQILRPARIRRRDLALPFPANNKSQLIIRTTGSFIGLIDRLGINQSVAHSREIEAAIASIANGRSYERSWRELVPFIDKSYQIFRDFSLGTSFQRPRRRS